jgi:hypothetical protein
VMRHATTSKSSRRARKLSAVRPPVTT